MEVEYVVGSNYSTQILWIKHTILDLSLTYNCVLIKYDNTSVTYLIKNLNQHSWTKHINIKHHFIMDLVHKGEICLEFVSIDIFTKSIPHDILNLLRIWIFGIKFHVIFQKFGSSRQASGWPYKKCTSALCRFATSKSSANLSRWVCWCDVHSPSVALQLLKVAPVLMDACSGQTASVSTIFKVETCSFFATLPNSSFSSKSIPKLSQPTPSIDKLSP